MMLKRFFFVMLMLNTLSVFLLVDAQSCDEFDTATDYATQAELSIDDGFLQEALELYTCALELDPDNLDYLNSRGIAYRDAEQYDNALADYGRILEFDETYPYVWNNRAIIYYYRGDVDLAIEGFTNAIELLDLPTISLVNRATIYYEQGDYGEAEKDLLLAIENDSEYKKSYLVLARVYTRLNSSGEQHPMFAEWIRLSMTETREINLSGSIEDEIYDMSEGMVYRLAFSGIARQTISMSARANPLQDADPLIVLLDGDEQAITSDDDSGVNLDAVISGFALPANGDYTLLLSHAGGGSTGEVTVSIDLGEPDGVDIANSFATFNLLIDELAVVYTTGGDRLNIRSGPGLEFEILTKLDTGTLVKLYEGPRKTDGYAWWRVRDDDGNEGWAVERVDEEQTLQLALLIGEDAIVTTGGDKLNVRTGAGSGNDLAFQLDEGARVTLLDAPEIVGGFQWWHIRTEDGQDGWTIDRFDGDRMLIPAKEVE